jgi:alpha-galactosidase/6-phospho-beta-glucosidase family protein
MKTGTPRVIYGNVRGSGLLPVLPADSCVEVPCLVDATGFHPTAATRMLDEVEARCDELAGAHGDLIPEGLKAARRHIPSARRWMA